MLPSIQLLQIGGVKMEIVDNIALWLSGIVFTIGITCIVYALGIKSQNEDLSRENQRLKIEKTNDINEPRDITADKYLIQLAQNYKELQEVRVIGINSLGVVHQAREDIKKLLEADKPIKFLLLNPHSDEFVKRVKDVECEPGEDFEKHKLRLIAEWNATVRILQSIRGIIKNKSLLEVRVRSEKPTHAFSATVSQKEEECFARINEYPPKGRGTRGKQFLCKKSLPAQKGTYEKYMDMYQKSWDNAEPISIDNEMWILSATSGNVRRHFVWRKILRIAKLFFSNLALKMRLVRKRR